MATYDHIPLTGNASVPAQYLAWLGELAKNQSNEQADAPFLSVLMRTQGKRDEMLKEALLSLEAQSDRDFEVILVIHRATDADKNRTLALLDSLSPLFKSQLTYRFLDTGTRSAPLNLALSVARGRYIAMLDDDDVVFENWVENFRKSAEAHDGMAIRCYGMTQFWTADTASDGHVSLQSAFAPQPTYCEPFDLQKHFTENYTPISCVALPRACHSVFGISFDETLTTAEDWDFLMRCVLICGVHDTKEITFLYRLWQNAESSHTLHQEKEWLANRAYIMNKLNQIPYITSNAGKWPPTPAEEADEPVLKLTFWQKLQKLYRTHGPLRFPFVVIRKIFFRLFG